MHSIINNTSLFSVPSESNAKQKHIFHCANDVLAVLGFVKLLNVFRNKKISQIMILLYILSNE